MDYQIQDQSDDKKYFTIIPNFVLNHSTATAQALYMQFKRMAGETGTAYPSMDYLAKQLKVSKPTLRKEIKYLLEKGWIKYAGEITVNTKGGTQKMKSYNVTNLWQLNMNFYDKGGKNETGLSNPRGEKRELARGEKIDPLRRTIKEEELKKKQQEPVGSGFKIYTKKKIGTIGDVLKKFTIPTTKPKGATYEWQDTAVRWWKKLGLDGKPTAGWFRLFKLNATLAERSCSWVSDSGGNDLEHLTYWAFNKFKKEGKITYEKK